MQPKPTIEAFDKWLFECSLKLEAIVIGGAALSLLGVIDRQTRDFDIIKPSLSPEVLQAAQDFALFYTQQGFELANDWLNNGPIQVADTLPIGWQDRVQPLFTGSALDLKTLHRSDLLKTKLFALCDRGSDLLDCIALAPTKAELNESLPWLESQDANPLWPNHVQQTLKSLAERLNYEL